MACHHVRQPLYMSFETAPGESLASMGYPLYGNSERETPHPYHGAAPMKRCLSCVLMMLSTPLFSAAQDTAENEQAIRQAGKEYVAAFNRHDAKAIAAQWSPDAVYTNRATGEQVTGRTAIEAQFVELFESQNDLKLDISVESIQFISPNVAVEHGTAKFLQPEIDPEQVEYTAVYVRRDGSWLLDRVTDEDDKTIPSQYEHLMQLEWMIGAWVDEDEQARIVTECNWTRNKNFINRSFTVAIEGQINMAGMQIIGWDAAAQQIRSWTFDSTGGFSAGTWSQKDNRWYISKKGILPDGRKASAVNVVTFVDDDTMTLQSVARSIDGEIQPNIDEVVIVRSSE